MIQDPQDIRTARHVGVVHVEVRERIRLGVRSSDGRVAADGLSTAMGMRPLGEEWRELPRDEAVFLLSAVLHRDLAYRVEIVPATEARRLAMAFVDQFAVGARFYTNGSFAWLSGNPGAEGAGSWWIPITVATFDTGIIAVDAERVGMAWVEDED